jgi:hypothetical protein
MPQAEMQLYPEFKYQADDAREASELSEPMQVGEGRTLNAHRSQPELPVERELLVEPPTNVQSTIAVPDAGTPQQFIENLQISLNHLKDQVSERDIKLVRYKRKIKKQSQEKQDLGRDLQAALNQGGFSASERDELQRNVQSLGGQLSHALQQLADKQDSESKLIDQTGGLVTKVKTLTVENSQLKQQVMTLQRQQEQMNEGFQQRISTLESIRVQEQE